MPGELGDIVKKMIGILKAHRAKSMSNTLSYLESMLGYSPETIRKWMQGKHKPDSQTLARLVEIGVAEAGMDAHWAERVLFQGEHPDRDALLRRLFPTPEAPSVRHNLPRRPYFHLVGREDQVTEIMRRLVPEQRHWIVPIEGVGGVGKSAMALEIGWRFVEGYDQLPSGRRFDSVIWVSAKREALTANGVRTIVQTQQTLTNLDDIYRAIAEVLEWPAILRLPRDEQPREVERALRRTGRTLVILDNLETVDDPQVLAFLRELAPPAKAIATMRFHEDMPYPIRLKELKYNAARELVIQECTGQQIRLTDEEIDELLEYTRGLPLAIWWAVGLMGIEGYGIQATLQSLRDPQGELLRFIFEQAVSNLRNFHPNAFHTLLALTFFDLDNGASLPALAATVNLDEETTRVALHRLLNMNLVNRTEIGERFTMLPLTYSYTRSEVEMVTAWEQEARERWAEWYSDWTEEFREYRESNSDITSEKGNLIEVLTWANEQRKDTLFVQLMASQNQPLMHGGYWDDYEFFAEATIEACKRLGNESVLRDILRSRALIYYERRDLSRAEEFLLAIEPTLYSLGPHERIQQLEDRCDICIAKKEWSQAKSLADEYLKGALNSLAIENNKERWKVFVGRAYLRLGRIARAQQLDKAMAYYRKASKIAPEDHMILREFAEIHLEEGYLEKANSILAQAEDVHAKQKHGKLSWAGLYLTQARVHQALGNHDKALALAQKALDLFIRLGMKEHLSEVEELIEQLHDKSN